MDTAGNGARRGRQRDPERMRRVLEAASGQFMRQGFDKTSMDAVAQASGVSKVTIYRYFPTKEALFEACIGSRTDTVFSDLSPAELDPRDPRGALTRMAERFLALKRSDLGIGAFRTMYAAGSQQEAACRAFLRQGPEKLVAQVARYLGAAHLAGSLVIEDPTRAADQFLSLFFGMADIRAMLGLGKPTARQDRELIAQNVRLFLRAHGGDAR
ncbi:MAG: TetR/AcrR family transcriptional regulator [Betaproteobacteria bacterium]|nr:TetR/AcrR family transcriptional regulator [Betaproteobacteria bacterium]